MQLRGSSASHGGEGERRRVRGAPQGGFLEVPDLLDENLPRREPRLRRREVRAVLPGPDVHLSCFIKAKE